MTTFSIRKSAAMQIEISENRLKVLYEGRPLELSIDRGEDGRLTPACRSMLANGLKAFVNRKPLQSPPRALCALHAAGVSLRRLSLPASANQDLKKMLLLQIEAEFPLAPEKLAWGSRELPGSDSAKRTFLVVAVKKEVVEDYASVLTESGIEPQFTLAALARNLATAQPQGSHAILHVGMERLEWCVFETGIPATLRVLPTTAEVSVLDSATKAVSGWTGAKIWLSGGSKDLPAQLAQRLGSRVECLSLGDEGTGSAMLGLKKALDVDYAAQLPLLELPEKPANKLPGISRSNFSPWLARAAVLACLLLILPYLEAVVLKPLLARKLSTLQADKGRLAMIDHEFDFLQALKQSQPPYLDALFVLSKFAPQGTRFDTLNMDRHGEITMHGILPNGQQVTDFRSKLIASGFFANVSVLEQSPTPDRQKVNVRMSAHWKPFEERANLAINPTLEEIQQAKTNHDAPAAGGMMFFPGMMPH